METLAQFLVGQRRLMFLITLLFTFAGLMAWFTLPREEDPRMPYRGAIIVVPFPGADALTVERLVLEPLEEELAEVVEIADVESTARAGVAVVRVLLRDEIYDVDAAYDDVERKIESARTEFPDAVLPPQFDRDIWDQESIVLAVTGSDDPIELRTAATELRRRLLAVPDVSRIIVTADPGEEIRVELREAAARAHGIDLRMLAAALGARNQTIPGGTIEAGGRTIVLSPQSEFETIQEIQQTPIFLPNGSAIPLGDIAEVHHTAVDPIRSHMRFNGEASIGLGIVPRDGLNIVTFGQRIRSFLDEQHTWLGDVRVEEVTFQPDIVEERLRSLVLSLLQSILVVALVLVVFMGPRLGLTVALVVPVVTLAALAVWAAAGGVLHQMSIAAMVLAMGMLVDNAIVVAEDVQDRLDAGESPWLAAQRTISTLLIPLGAATGTTVAAFVPMLLSTGPTGDFTRAIPTLVILTLIISYVVAIAVTPSLAAMFLTPRKAGEARTSGRYTDWIGNLTVRHPIVILVLAIALVASVGTLAPRLKSQFFPASDRNQFIVDVTLPEGTHIDLTDATSQQLENHLLSLDEVQSVAAFTGNGAPHFYYNVISRPSQPNLAQYIVTTRTLADVAPVMQSIREFADSSMPGAEVIAKRIEQGPPVGAPIEIRLTGESLVDLHQASDRVVEILRQSPGATDIRSSMGQGAAALDWEIDDVAAGQYGLSRSDVALALLGQSHGIQAGQYRAAEDPIPVVVRGAFGEALPADDVATLDVATPGGRPVPLMAVARENMEWRPASIEHRNRSRIVTVSAQVADGYTFSDVMRHADPMLDAVQLPTGIRLGYGGETEGAGEANAALLMTLPLGMMLLLGFLMFEFNSFRQVAIIMTTVPLAATGIIPGLLLNDQPFGFMSVLGVIALVGIVVNNAIVLLDVVNIRRAAGASVQAAVSGAVSQRIRPILLTTGTTVLGLLPLALTESTLWPPLASAMISGLLASTVLTLFVVPALYRLLFPDSKPAAPTANPADHDAVGADASAVTA
jgi:multidrug efflux pump subunit AcrB